MSASTTKGFHSKSPQYETHDEKHAADLESELHDLVTELNCLEEGAQQTPAQGTSNSVGADTHGQCNKLRDAKKKLKDECISMYKSLLREGLSALGTGPQGEAEYYVRRLKDVVAAKKALMKKIQEKGTDKEE